MEKIKIQNFAGIKDMEFEFKSINILIGPQGTGKSVTVKLHFFFRSFFRVLRRNMPGGYSEQELDNRQREKFITFFPKESWSQKDFNIIYTLNDIQISLKRIGDQIKFDYSDSFKKVISGITKLSSRQEIRNVDTLDIHNVSREMELREEIGRLIQKEVGDVSINNQFFIPAGRSFFANIQKSIFSLINDNSANSSLDPFLIEFGANYESLRPLFKDFERTDHKEFDEIIAEILNGAYVRENDEDYLVHKDNRKVNLSNASSGQQETLPLIVILKVLNNVGFSSGGVTIYIEEPEAHLFPNAQKAIVQLLVRVFNNKNNFQIFVTTHSPYILSSFNNLLEAGRLTELKPDKAEDIAKIVPVAEQLKPGLLTAYSLIRGKKENLVDQETNLITQTVLDNISNDIAIEFGKLLDIEF